MSGLAFLSVIALADTLEPLMPDLSLIWAIFFCSNPILLGVYAGTIPIQLGFGVVMVPRTCGQDDFVA